MIARSPLRPIALVGLSGAGKSTLAPLLAARLGVSAIDLDRLVEERTGRRIAELFAAEGEARFRALEREALERGVAAGAGVIACGGGIVESTAGRALLRERCLTVWLEVEPAEASGRVGDAASERPLLGAAPAARLGELLARRAPWYAEVAAARVRTDGLGATEVLERVKRAIAALARAEAGT